MKNGQQLKLTVIIPNVFGNGAGDFLVSAWGKLGIKVNAVTEPVAQAVQTFVTPGSDWDVFLAGGGDYSPTVMATLALPGPPNFSRVQNAAFDQLESQAAAQPTQTSCTLWNSAEEELYKAGDCDCLWAQPDLHTLAFVCTLPRHAELDLTAIFRHTTPCAEVSLVF
jgi:ABC-type transport system substrate-binding protein